MNESEDMYIACAEVYSASQAAKDDLEALLNPDTGFAPRLKQICRDQSVSQSWMLNQTDLSARIAEYEDSADARITKDEIDLLRVEENTWGLLQAVMPCAN